MTLTERQFRMVYGDFRITLFTLLQPLIMLLLFSQVFGRMANPDSFPAGVPYINFLLPALMVTTSIGSAQGAGLGLARDMDSGMTVRFRAMPVRLPLVLLARSLTDLVRVAMQITTLLACGWLFLDFRPSGGWMGVLVAMSIALLVAWSLIWVFLALSAWLRSVEVLSSIGFLVTFPLMFASSAFVPLGLLPGWLQVIARVNPLTYAVDACRGAALGWPVGWTVVAAVATASVLLGGAFAIAVVMFRRPADEAVRRWRLRPSSAS